MTISTSSTAPLVAIIGITGNQGGSVARALKESNKPYRIRGLARDAQKLAAQAFAELGAKIVSVSLTIGNEASVRATFSGANIIFAVTNFNEHFDKERVRSPYLKSRRKAHGEGGVSLFVWSGLESFTKLSGGRISGAAFLDSKAAIFDYARASGIPPAIVQAGYHTTNVLSSVSYTLQPQADDSFLYRLPMTGSARVPLIDVESDFGLYVRAAIESPTLAAGSEPLSGQLVSLDDLIAELTKATGKKITYSPYTRAEFAEAFPFKAMVNMVADMCQAYEQLGCYGPKPVTSFGRELVEATPKESFPESIRPA